MAIPLGIAACTAPPTPPTDVLVVASSASYAPSTAPAALCVATTEDAGARAFFRAYLGDATVLKLSSSFEDHADVASLLVANGATSAEPFVTESALLETDRLSVPIVATGRDLHALEPYVRTGALAQMGPGDVAIADSAAMRLGIGLGDRVTLVRGAPSFKLSLPRRARRGALRVAAILRFPGEAIHHYGDRTIFLTLDGLRAVGVDPAAVAMGIAAVEEETTGLRVSGDAKLAPAWTDALAKRGGLYRVATSTELADAGYELARTSAIAVCAPDAASGGTVAAATPRPDTLRPCDDMKDLDPSKDVRAALFGQGFVVDPDPTTVEAKALARGATHVDRGVVLDGAVASGAGIQLALIDAVGPARQETLARYVVRGDLSKLASSRGTALSADLAAALGVDVGSHVVVRATPDVASRETSSRVWRAPVVAIVRLPAEAVHRVGLEWVWADDAVIRSAWGLSSDMSNVARIQWPGGSDTAPFVRMIPGIAVQSVLDMPNALALDLLQTACATPR
ncbi:MAG: hypothetical protein U0414_31000 [Polyangiaceae bacterium]